MDKLQQKIQTLDDKIARQDKRLQIQHKKLVTVMRRYNVWFMFCLIIKNPCTITIISVFVFCYLEII